MECGVANAKQYATSAYNARIGREDDGPATKLPGTLEYIRERPETTRIIAIDDDILIDDSLHLRYLNAFATVMPASNSNRAND